MIIPKFTDGFFEISSEHGFLPKQDPLTKLPAKYNELQLLLDNMTVHKDDGTRGLIGNDDLFIHECAHLPDYTTDISNEVDIYVLTALYRSYCFLSSAYLLEPSYNHFLKSGTYGVARDKLPVNIAQPLIKVASMLDIFPFLEYSYGYSLGNYVRLDKNKGLEWDNLGMANKFSGMSDEVGFIMVHVDINRHTPDMIRSINNVLKLIYNDNDSKDNDSKDNDSKDNDSKDNDSKDNDSRDNDSKDNDSKDNDSKDNDSKDNDSNDNDQIVKELHILVKVLKNMNSSRKQMWKASRSSHYNDFRVFIMGIKGNTDIFPKGVIYEPETEQRYYRGQSGSQDTIIPFLDTVFHIDDHYPNNMLTQYLLDMRQYRPKPFRDLLDWTKNNLGDFVSRLMNIKNIAINVELYKIYREVYRFRNGHWQFIQQYIMENTKYPVATGGTPITTWVPNQISATLNAMNNVIINSKSLDQSDTYQVKYQKYVDEYIRMRECLDKQIEELSKPFYKPDSVFELNKNYKLNDI